MRCQLKVDLSTDPTLADAFHVEDAEGNRLSLFRMTISSVTETSTGDLLEGRSSTWGWTRQRRRWS